MRVKGKSYERILNDGFTYNITVPVKKAGAYQLRTALRDVPTQRVGSASQFIEVPDMKKNRLALSGILMSGMPPQLAQKNGVAVSAQSGSSDDSLVASDPDAGADVRRLKRGLVVVYSYAIYNAQIDNTTGKPQLKIQVRMFLDGKQVFGGKETPFDASNQPDLKRLAMTGAFQLGSLMAPGEYVLQIIVTDALAKEKYNVASQWTDFEIVK